MPSVIILQRSVPRYRSALFQRLHDLFGWSVVCAGNFPGGSFLDLERNAPFLIPFDFEFPDPRDHYRVNVPLGRILRSTGAKAVISEFSLKMSSSYELALRRRFRGGPVTLFWSHGYNMHRNLASWRNRVFQTPRVMLSRMVDGHICYSEEGRDFLAKYIPDDRLFVARNTIDLSPMRRLANEIGRVEGPGRPRLLTIGRLEEYRGAPRLVEVFHEFRKSNPGAVLTIIGDGPDAERTRQAAGGELGRSICMPGGQYDETVLARYFLSSDLVVFPGAVGLSVNHALAYGVPVMAFDRTTEGPDHGPEIAYVKDGVTGRRVPEFSNEALLEALRGFFSAHPDPKSDFGETIRKYVDDNLTLDSMVDDFGHVRAFLARLGVE